MEYIINFDAFYYAYSVIYLTEMPGVHEKACKLCHAFSCMPDIIKAVSGDNACSARKGPQALP